MGRFADFSVVFALVALAGACSPKIGDDCIVSTNCSNRGDRICDLSYRVDSTGFQNPNGRGECTIDGCARGNCPKEAGCVKVYSTQFFSVACDPTREDVAIACSGDDCPAADCDHPDAGLDCCASVSSPTGDATHSCPPLDACDNNEICLPEGVCATEVGARTSCRFECKNNGDCRAGYHCVRTGFNGIYAAPSIKHALGTSEIKICAPDV